MTSPVKKVLKVSQTLIIYVHDEKYYSSVQIKKKKKMITLPLSYDTCCGFYEPPL